YRSWDHSICSSQNIGWYCQADLLGGFKVNNEFELLRLFDGKFGRLRPFKDLVHIASGPAYHVRIAWRVVLQAASVHELASALNCWQAVLFCETYHPLSRSIDKGARVCHESLGAFPFRCFKCGLKIVEALQVKGYELNP